MTLWPFGALTARQFELANRNTFRLLLQVRRSDALAIVLVTVLAVTTNLAIAVFVGVVWAALVSSIGRFLLWLSVSSFLRVLLEV